MNVFISHIQEEEQVAKIIKKWLESTFIDKLKVFVSGDNIESGDRWMDIIRKELKDTDIILVIISPLSISKMWVNFESGCGWILEKPLIPLCHSGIMVENLPLPYKAQHGRQIDNSGFSKIIIEDFKKRLMLEHIPNIKYEAFQNELNNAIKKIVLRRTAIKDIDQKEMKFLPVTIKRNGRVLSIIHNESSVVLKTDIDEGIWEKKVNEMEMFLSTNEDMTISDIGLAIGVQNCLCFYDDVYMGLRTKSEINEITNSELIGKGSINTGYKLLRERDDSKYLAYENLHDLFVSMPPHNKNPVNVDSSIYSMLKNRLKNNLCLIKFNNTLILPAIIFVNHSRRYPRFEIGIIKYINISKENLISGIVPGFGSDAFEEQNFWIWVKNREIHYRSYKRMKYINRGKEITKYSRYVDVLTTTQFLLEKYDLRERYLPNVSDELLNKGEIINIPFSSPARSLIEIF